MQNKFAIRVVLAAIVALSAVAAIAQGRYQISADGREVEDRRSTLTWARCAEGMDWNGKICLGKLVQLPYPLALRHVADGASRGAGGWRLPTVKELATLAQPREADVDAGIAAIDPAAFPNTPPLRFWTSSVAGPHYYMYVSFKDGESGENSRSMAAAIRLVRDKK